MRNNVSFTEINTEVDGALDEMLKKQMVKELFHKYFLTSQYIGGYEEIRALEKDTVTDLFKIKRIK